MTHLCTVKAVVCSINNTSLHGQFPWHWRQNFIFDFGQVSPYVISVLSGSVCELYTDLAVCPLHSCDNKLGRVCISAVTNCPSFHGHNPLVSSNSITIGFKKLCQQPTPEDPLSFSLPFWEPGGCLWFRGSFCLKTSWEENMQCLNYTAYTEGIMVVCSYEVIYSD